VVIQISGGRNAADMAITIAAMDALHEGTLMGVCLVTSDRDFTPLVQRLRRGGLRVEGLGLDKTPQSLRKACTTFTVLGEKAKAPALKAVG
jgi:uncharacterized LabA/DUF88 family protein